MAGDAEVVGVEDRLPGDRGDRPEALEGGLEGRQVVDLAAHHRRQVVDLLDLGRELAGGGGTHPLAEDPADGAGDHPARPGHLGGGEAQAGGLGAEGLAEGGAVGRGPEEDTWPLGSWAQRSRTEAIWEAEVPWENTALATTGRHTAPGTVLTGGAGAPRPGRGRPTASGPCPRTPLRRPGGGSGPLGPLGPLGAAGGAGGGGGGASPEMRGMADLG